jgi:iron-sulfur cluster repair protein YtfE (RIC family)
MNNEKGSKPNYGSPNMMDTIKTNIMTMMMINGSKSGTGDNGAMTMVYLFVVTQVLDFLMKMLPFLVQRFERFEKVYNDKIKSMKELADTYRKMAIHMDRNLVK